jgi:hypothetical protein
LKGFLLILLLLFLSVSVHGQTVTQTYTDRCTGEVRAFQIPIQGSTVIVFYNRSKTVTLSDVQSGAFQQWLDETYNWWRNLNPCSIAQASTTVTQLITNSVTNMPAIPSSTSPVVGNTNTTTSNSSSASNNESSESSAESSSEESSDSSEEESSEEEEKTSSLMAAPIVAANLAAMQSLDGTVNIVTSFGLSQSSLTGATTNSANLLVWDNLQQFALNLSRSTLIFDSNQNLKLISGLSVNLIYAFGTKVITIGTSNMFLGQPNTWRKGMVYGYAANIMALFSDRPTLTYTLTTFGTKPFIFNRKTISPLLAITTNPTLDIKTSIIKYNVGLVFGSNFDFDLTKRFKANIGGNLIKGANVPLVYAITIGSRFQF